MRAIASASLAAAILAGAASTAAAASPQIGASPLASRAAIAGAEVIAATPAPGPSLRVVSYGRGLQVARLRSFNTRIDVAGASSLKAWVILPSSAVAAAEAGLGGPSAGDAEAEARTLARVSMRQPPSGRLVLRFAFDGPAQEALMRFFQVGLILRITATDLAGHATTVEQPVVLSD